MKDNKHRSPILVFACGNGDDALGSELLRQIEPSFKDLPKHKQIKILTYSKFQVEHTMDL